MKRIVAVLLTAILLISCLPLTAMAAKTDTAQTAAGVEAKFRLLLEDMELVDNVHQSDRYFFEELGQYPKKNPEWVLICGGLYDLSAKNNIQYQYAAFGNKFVRANVNSSPFKLGYGVYDVKSGVFYDLIDAWDMNLNNLRDTWDDLAPTTAYSPKDKKSENAMYVIGDADADGEVTILDATRIQRCLADLDDNPWKDFAATGSEFIRGTDIAGATDYDRDGDTTILDATRIQRNLAELPSVMSYKLAWDESFYEGFEEGQYLVTDRSQLDSTKRDQKMILDAYKDSFFKNNCLVALKIMLNSGSYHLTLKSVALDKDGVLNVDFTRNDPETVTEDMNPRFVVIELTNAFVDDIKDINVNIVPIKPVDPDASLLYTKIPPVSQQTVIPENPWDQGFDKIYTSSIGMSALSPYNFALWQSFPDDLTGNSYVMLLRSRSEMEKLLPGFDPDDKYDDAWFNTYAIIGMISSTDDGLGGYAEIGLTGKKDNVLYLEASVKYPDYGNTAPTSNAGIIPVWTFLAVSKHYINDVTELKLWHGRANETGTVYTEIPRWNEIPEMPDVPSAAGYKELDATPITVSSPSWDDFSFSDTPLGDPGKEGYVIVIRSRAGLEKYLPRFDTEGKYDDAYFKNYAIVCALVQGSDYYSKAFLTNIAVKGNTLYACAGESIDQQYDEEGTPISLPVASIVHTFCQVRQSDVADVSAVSCWASPYPAIGAKISSYEIENYRSYGSFSDEHDEAYLLTKPADVVPALDKLFVSDLGYSVDHSDHTFKVENYTESDFGARHIIAMRVFQGSSDSTVTVNNVRRTGRTELTVDVTRFVPDNPTPDMNWRFIFLSIPDYGKDFTVKVNTLYEEQRIYNGFVYTVNKIDNQGNKAVTIDGYRGNTADLTIPDTIEGYPVTEINTYAFKDNKIITSVSVPDSVTDLNYGAFSGCENLVRIHLPASVTGVKEYTFANCVSLRWLDLYGDQLVKTIGDYAFLNCESLEYVIFDNSLTSIGAAAFRGCDALTKVQFEENLKTIGEDAFLDCNALKELRVPKSVTAIGKRALGYTVDEETNLYVRRGDFTIFGYVGSTAQTYANNYGFTFKSIDNAGPVQYTTEDIRMLPKKCGVFSDKTEAIYCTSADELTAALDTLYNGKRDQDSFTYKPEGYGAEWFESHDVVAIRTGMNKQEDELFITYVGLDYFDTLVVDIDKFSGSDVTDEYSAWCIALISLDKLGFVPEITLYGDYINPIEPLKPIIYLYPEEETELTVTVGKPEDLTCTYPDYGDGWHVTAKPDGTLIDDSGRSYYALYWEGKTAARCDTSEGFVVKGEDTAKFFEEKLAALGLNEREAQEFIVYWLPQLQNNKYNFIRFATMKEIEEIMPLDFSVKPDTLIRILMEYKPLDEAIEVKPQTLTAPERKGFTAVEWGGCLIE